MRSASPPLAGLRNNADLKGDLKKVDPARVCELRKCVHVFWEVIAHRVAAVERWECLTPAATAGPAGVTPRLHTKGVVAAIIYEGCKSK